MSEAELRGRFDAVYDRMILGRRFVEYAEYYIHSRERFWNAVRRFARFGLPQGAPLLDVGGGQFGILARELFGCAAYAADVNARAEPDIRAAGLGFHHLDLALRPDATGAYPPEPDGTRYRAITLLEVIEHLPLPPYVVLGRLAGMLEPGGVILITTPNGYRIRNILYMLTNRRILDHYRYPAPGENLGHQMEYTLGELAWQSERAGFAPVFAELYDEGWAGSTPARRLARRLVRPLNLVPHLRNGIVLGLRRAGPGETPDAAPAMVSGGRIG